MACLLWNDGSDSGCLDFGAAQMVGRICFPGGPDWIPRKLFEVYELQGGWIIYSKDCPDWITVKVYDKDKWVSIRGLNPVRIGHQTMIQFSMDGHRVKLLFLIDAQCTQATHPGYLWKAMVWDEKPVDDDVTAELPPKSTDEAVPEIDKVWARRLTWMALYFEQHTWAAVAAIATFVALIAGGSYAVQNHLIPDPIQKAITNDRS
jgi:hypothetical protein